MSLWLLWLAGRLLLAWPWFSPLVSAAVDGAFLVLLAMFVWREIATGGSRSQAPIGIVISLYAGANILFHVLALRGAATDLPERMALAFIMLLLTMIGGRVTPNFTREFLAQVRMPERVASFLWSMDCRSCSSWSLPWLGSFSRRASWQESCSSPQGQRICFVSRAGAVGWRGASRWS